MKFELFRVLLGQNLFTAIAELPTFKETRRYS